MRALVALAYLVVERHFRDESARLVDDLAAGRIEAWTRSCAALLGEVTGPTGQE